MNAVPLRPNKLPLAEAVANSPIAAGANVPLSIVPGNFFYVASASHPNFTIELNDEVKLSGRLALGHVFPEGVLITKFRVYKNDRSQALTIKVLVGRGAPPCGLRGGGRSRRPNDLQQAGHGEGNGAMTVASRRAGHSRSASERGVRGSP